MNIEKWQKAVINIEAAGKDEFILNRIDKCNEIITRWRKGGASINSLIEEYSRVMKSKKLSGTAIYFLHDNKQYLITAKHIVYDDVVQNGANTLIYNAIFRIPSFDECLNGLADKPAQLHSLNKDNLPAAFFFHPHLDLAIILLDDRNDEFNSNLLQLGHEPITVEDIDQSDVIVGTDIFTVGFPGGASLVMQTELALQNKPWKNTNFSLPIAAFGKVIMNSRHLNFFWTDLNLYVGNAGGPVIANDKLIGIIGGHTSSSAESGSYQHSTVLPFNGILKAKYIFELIQAYIKNNEEHTK